MILFRHILILLLFLLSGNFFAQEKAIDSLINEAKLDATSDNELVNQLSNWQKAFNLIKDNGSDYRLTEICTELGDLFFDSKIYDTAIEYYQYVLTSGVDTTRKSASSSVSVLSASIT